MTDKKAKFGSSFITKLSDLIQNPQSQYLIHWNSEGNAFVIQNASELSQLFLPKFFKHNNFASFVRQLNMYRFSKVHQTEEQIVYRHLNFKKQDKKLRRKIKRRSVKQEKDEPSSQENKHDKHKQILEISEDIEKISQKFQKLKKKNQALVIEKEGLNRLEESFNRIKQNQTIEFLKRIQNSTHASNDTGDFKQQNQSPTRGSQNKKSQWTINNQAATEEYDFREIWPKQSIDDSLARSDEQMILVNEKQEKQVEQDQNYEINMGDLWRVY